jgi:hypothetical protein
MEEFINRNVQTLNERVKPGVFSEVLYGFTLVVIVYLVLLFVEVIYKYINRLSLHKTVLLANTYSTDNKTIIVPQNPNLPGSKVVNVSNNEPTGIECSYSFYLLVNPASFRQEVGLLHIFHKGYSSQFPLLAPGVYMCSNTNTLRVYMNTYRTWNNYVDVDNIPVNKWVHVVIVCKNNALEVFINGNLKKKLSFEGYAPYQNYQDIVCFSQRRITLKQTTTPSVDKNGFDVFGAMKGLVSHLQYFSYALCYAEIQQLMKEGPSSKMGDSLDTSTIPPYLDDTWWTQGN